LQLPPAHHKPDINTTNGKNLTNNNMSNLKVTLENVLKSSYVNIIVRIFMNKMKKLITFSE